MKWLIVVVILSFLDVFGFGQSLEKSNPNTDCPQPNCPEHGLFVQIPQSSFFDETEYPQGHIEQFEFNESKIYPGTERMVTVYIPKQINPFTTACVYVSQDGYSPEFTDAMDMLIAKKEMPVTVGVFVSPGQMKSLTDTFYLRDNRPYEYNNLGDDYARFLLKEILPLVASKYSLNLSQNANDRGIGGCSSGGICAFNVAWERPDEFRRVYSSCGSFVAYNGGDVFPVLIRKCEPKPIRIYLHGARKDLNNEGGSFWLTYKLMESAFAFSGYDFKAVESDDGHCESYSSGFSDAMRWLWRDYPESVKSGSGSPYLNSVIKPEERWTLLKDNLQNVKSLTANSKGEVLFCDGSNCICRLSDDGNIAILFPDAQHVCGLSAGNDGLIYAISETDGKIFAFSTDGRKRVVAKNIRGSAITAIGDGSFYVSGIENGTGKVWHVGKNGEKHVVAAGLRNPVGCVISNDGKLLHVADYGSHWIYSYMIDTDFSLQNKEHSIWLHTPDNVDDSGGGSICIDSGQHIFVSTRMGIWIGTDQPYESQCIMSSPTVGQVLSLCLIGNKLYATDGNKIFVRIIKVPQHVGMHPITE